ENRQRALRISVSPCLCGIEETGWSRVRVALSARTLLLRDRSDHEPVGAGERGVAEGDGLRQQRLDRRRIENRGPCVETDEPHLVAVSLQHTVRIGQM